MLVSSSLLFIRCTPEQMMASTTKEIIQQGNWSVGYYFDGQDKTADYHGLTFTYNGDGTMNCSDGTTDYPGTWSTSKDASRNEVLTMSIQNAPSSVGLLNTQWTIGSVALNSIGMKNSSSNQLVMKKL
jgi:hypothetical protein